MRARVSIVLVFACLPCVAQATPGVSPLGFQWFGTSEPEKGLLAQRSIDREWPMVGDSGVATPRPGERSPIAAMVFSAAVPGSGQVYAGARREALGYAAVEVAGWVEWALLRRGADRLRNDATELAGPPADSASAWSFERWEDVTGQNGSQVRSLYSADREAFYDAIAGDAKYSAGWSDPGTRTRFGDLRRRSDRRLETARWTSAGRWVNHLVAAVQALRAVRLGNMNMNLGNQVQLKARGRIEHGRPSLLVTLQRRF